MAKNQNLKEKLRTGLLPLFIKQSGIGNQNKNQQQDRSNNVECFERANNDAHCFSFANLRLAKNETSAVASPANAWSGLVVSAPENNGATTEATNTSPRFPIISDNRSSWESLSSILNHLTAFWSVCQIQHCYKTAKYCFYVAVISGLLAVSSGVTAAPTEFSSQNYKLESLNFGTENTLFSTEQSIGPKISGEGPQVSDLTDTSATVKWETDRTSSSIVGYGKAQGQLTSEAGKSTELVTSHKVVLVGLEAETTYHYKVSSKDKVGNLGESAVKTFITKKSAAISGVQVTDITLTSALVNFTTSAIVNAVLRYGATSDYNQEVKEQSGSFTTNHTLRLGNLTTGTTYHARIFAQDESGKQIQSDDYLISTLPLPNVRSISLKDLTSSQVTVAIEANTEVTAEVEYYTKAPVEVLGVKPGERRTEGSTTKSLSHKIKLVGLIGDAQYFYRLILTDGFGNRTTTGENSFSTPRDSVPPKLTPPKVEHATQPEEGRDLIQVVVTWSSDKPATSKLLYQPGSVADLAQAPGTPENTSLVTNHFLIVELRPASTYSIQAVSRDYVGNVGKSGVTSVLTPRKQRSIFQFVIERLNEIFGAVFRLLQ